jgi:NNP family nitrate/nitrite transporter-like MFS transporter
LTLIPASTFKSIQESETVRFSQRLPCILFLVAILLFNFLARYIWGPLLVNIEADLGIRHTAAGSFFLLITAGYFIGLLASGHLSSRLNHQKTAVLSCLVCALSLLAASFAPSLGVLSAALVMVGATAGLYLPTEFASLTYRLKPADFGKAFSIHEVAPSLGFIIGPLMADMLLGWGTWRTVLVPVAAGLLALGLLYAFSSATGDFRGEAPTLRNMRFVASRPAFWIMVVLFSLSVGTNVGVYSMLPLYLQAGRNMDQTVANVILSASRVAAIFTPFAAGWIAGRVGARAVVTVVVFLCGVATVLLGLVPDNWLWLPLFLQPMLASAFFPPAFAILTAVVPPGFRNLIVALIMPVGMLVGSGGLPVLIGALADEGLFRTGFILTGAMVVASTALLAFVKVAGDGSDHH